MIMKAMLAREDHDHRNRIRTTVSEADPEHAEATVISLSGKSARGSPSNAQNDLICSAAKCDSKSPVWNNAASNGFDLLLATKASSST